MQTSLESPAKLASITNQLNIGGIDFRIINIISRDNIALKLLVLTCLFNRSNCLIPLNSILIKYKPIKPRINGNKKLKKPGKKPVKFKLKKEFKRTSKTLTKNKKEPKYKKV
ncbi:hypothetical protein IDG86_05345 [Pelagibacterales bacterium SAG-MED13]|nr:hypothetical protein [Pelagibacterales bacterium SAG-MED13]